MNPSVAAVLQVLVQAKGISQVNSQLAGMNSQLAATSTKSGAMGAAVKKGMMVGAAAIGAAGVALFKLGKSFDDAYDTIRVGTGATGKKLEGLERDFKSVVKSVPTDFKSAGMAIAELNTRLGLTGKPLQERSKQFLELSRITKTDVKTNIREVTRAFGDWEVKTSEQAGTLDKFFRASQSSGASVNDLASSVVKFGAPLRQVGFSLDEATAMFASFEKAGVNTQTMMPGLKMALKSFMSEGIDPKAGLAATFKGIKDGSIDAAQAMKIFGVRAGPDMVEAVRQGRFDLDAMTKTLVNGSDTIMKAGKDTQDFGEKWQMIKNRVLVGLEPLAMAVFNGMGKAMDILPPIVSRIYEALRTLLTPFTSLTGAITGNKTAMVALGAASAVLLAAWAGFAIVAGVTKAIRATVGAFWALNAAMAANPIGLVVVALAALVAGLVIAYRESKTFRDIVNGAWQALKAAAGAIFPAIVGVIRTTWDTISTVTSTVWNAIKAVTTTVWAAIATAILTPVRLARDLMVDVVAGIANRLAAGWLLIKTTASTAWIAVRDFILTPVRGARDTIGEVVTGIGNRLSAGWTLIKSAASMAWDAVRSNILTPVREARDAIGDVITGLANRVQGGWDSILKGARSFAGNVKDAIVDAVKGAANKVIGFVNKILEVIEMIPGIKDGSLGRVKEFAEGGKHAKGVTGGGPNGNGQLAFARGGFFGATGGYMNRPVAIGGEESPRFAEFVIPTNPAYRDRAQMLLAQAAGAIGFAEGGVVSAFKSAINQTNASAKPSLALFEAGIVESGLRNLPYGDRDSLGALQLRAGIHGRELAMSPLGSALAFLTRGFTGAGGAISLSNSGRTAGQVAQAVQGSAFPDRYDQVRGQAQGFLGGGGILDAIGGAISSVGGVLGDLLSKGAGFLLDKLPGVGDLPDFLKGTGKYVLGKAGDFIKDKVSSLVGLAGGGGAVGGGVTGSVQGAMALARQMGLQITSTTGGQHAKNSYHYKGRAADVAGSAGQMAAFFNASLERYGKNLLELFYDPLGAIKNGQRIGAIGGHADHVHIALAKGGVYGGGLLGSYAGGTDYVPQTGPYLLHRGESVQPAAQGGDEYGRGNVIITGPVTMRNEQDARVTAERLAFRLKYSG